MSAFRLPSQRQRRSLAKAQKQYATNRTLASGFLNARGIGDEWAERWGLGVVTSPLPSHERFRGRLCIPYRNRSGVIGLKFRCLNMHDCKTEGHGKYDQPAGQTQSLFNILAVDRSEQEIHVTEGEMDCIVLSEVLGQPVVGVPGVDQWHDHWVTHFRGFDQVILWQHGDKAGRAMGVTWGQRVGVELVELPLGHDVNSYYVEFGPAKLKALYEEATGVSGGD
jgi:DNA primase